MSILTVSLDFLINVNIIIPGDLNYNLLALSYESSHLIDFISLILFLLKLLTLRVTQTRCIYY